MICDPTVECVCDECGETVYIDPEYKFNDYSGNSGQYDISDEAIECELEQDHFWKKVNGKHLCESCWPEK